MLKKWSNVSKILILSLLFIIISCQCSKHFDNKDNIYYQEISKQGQQVKQEVKKRNIKAFFQKGGFEKIRALVIDKRKQFDLPANIISKNQFEVENIKGYKVYKLTKLNNRKDLLMIFLHGGGYLLDAGQEYVSFCDDLVNNLNINLLLPIYPLAPQATVKDGYKFLLSLYKKELKQNKKIILIGDSSGAGFAVGLAEFMVKNKIKMPESLILISPWLDVTMLNPNVIKREERDIFLASYGLIKAGKLWAGKLSTLDYKISPIYGNVNGLPKTLIFTGTDDMLYPDATKFFQKLKKNDIPTTLIVGKGLYHDYLFYDEEKKVEALKLMNIFLNE